MFKSYYGNCKSCPPEKISLIVVKAGFCKFHNEKNKKKDKKIVPKKIKPRKQKNIKSYYGQCIKCPVNTITFLVVKNLCHYHNEQQKKLSKSGRIIKLVNKAEKQNSVKHLKKKLDDIFSLFIRYRGSKDGKNRCFTCNIELPIKELQNGHYESRRFLALRYAENNNHCQCFYCNIVLKGNYTVYSLKMIEKYGKEHLDLLSIKKNNIIKWTAFEYQLMIDEYTEKLNKLMNG